MGQISLFLHQRAGPGENGGHSSGGLAQLPPPDSFPCRVLGPQNRAELPVYAEHVAQRKEGERRQECGVPTSGWRGRESLRGGTLGVPGRSQVPTGAVGLGTAACVMEETHLERGEISCSCVPCLCWPLKTVLMVTSKGWGRLGQAWWRGVTGSELGHLCPFMGHEHCRNSNFVQSDAGGCERAHPDGVQRAGGGGRAGARTAQAQFCPSVAEMP